MKHRADEDFRAAYDQLPQDVRQRADDAFQKLKTNPKHPSIHFKKVTEVGLHVSTKGIAHWR